MAKNEISGGYIREEIVPEYIRVSIGCANLLKLNSARNKINPTTCYLMSFTEIACAGHCQFCPQGMHEENKNKKYMGDQLSRVTWPKYEFEHFLERFQNHQSSKIAPFKRICLQILNYPENFEETLSVIMKIHKLEPKMPISGSIPPLSFEQMKTLHQNGLERISIALDAASPELFAKIKGCDVSGPYSWENHWNALIKALEIFGKGYVSTHIIVGLGESEEEIIHILYKLIDLTILPALFLFTPIKGTKMEFSPRPPIVDFRRIQLIRFMLMKNIKNIERISFVDNKIHKIENFSGFELKSIIDQELAFQTTGCPGCNRPYYTSSPKQEPDGFPSKLTNADKESIYNELLHLIINKEM